jgi:hypothetical protein
MQTSCTGSAASPLLKMMSKRTIAIFLPKIATWYWSFLKSIRGANAGERKVHLVTDDVPYYPAIFALHTGMEYNARSLEICGAQKATSRVHTYTPTGERDGMPHGHLIYELEWTT